MVTHPPSLFFNFLSHSLTLSLSLSLSLTHSLTLSLSLCPVSLFLCSYLLLSLSVSQCAFLIQGARSDHSTTSGSLMLIHPVLYNMSSGLLSEIFGLMEKKATERHLYCLRWKCKRCESLLADVPVPPAIKLSLPAISVALGETFVGSMVPHTRSPVSRRCQKILPWPRIRPQLLLTALAVLPTLTKSSRQDSQTSSVAYPMVMISLQSATIAGDQQSMRWDKFPCC